MEIMLQTYIPDILPTEISSISDNNTEVTTSDNELPAALLLVSPVMCAETKTPSWKENAKHDMVGPKLFKKVFKEYFGTTDPLSTDVRLIAMTHMQDGFEQFIPKNAMVIVGSKEAMRDDITEMALRVVKNSDINGHLVSEDYAHDWYVIRDTVKDKSALKRCDALFAEFVVNALKDAQLNANGDGKLSDSTSADTDKQHPSLPVKFTRNGITMSFSKTSMQEILGNIQSAGVSKQGIAKTLDSLAKMTTDASTNYPRVSV